MALKTVGVTEDVAAGTAEMIVGIWVIVAAGRVVLGIAVEDFDVLGVSCAEEELFGLE